MAARHHTRDESINKEKNKNSNEKNEDKILKDIDLSHLSTEQQQKAVNLITNLFCQDSDDIDNVQNYKIKIRLKDEPPV